MSEHPRHGVVAVIPRGERLLVIRRSQHVVAPGKFCFPGGGIKLGEDEVSALIRELREELGVRIRPLRRIWRSTTPWDVRLSWWLGEVPSDVRIDVNAAEVQSVHWMQPSELHTQQDLLESNRHFLAALGKGQFVLSMD